MKVTGIARNVEFTQPSLIGRFFGNNAFLFLLNMDSPIRLPSGAEVSFLPVRFECFLRIPNFDGQKIDIEGDFDPFDKLIRGKRVHITDSGIEIGAARRFGLFASIVLLTVWTIVQFFLFVLAGRALAAAAQADTPADLSTGHLIVHWLQTVGINLLPWIVLILAFSYMKRVALPTIMERIDHLLRRVTEYR